MFCDAAIPETTYNPQSGAISIGRTYSSAASNLKSPATGFFGGFITGKHSFREITSESNSISNKIGALLRQQSNFNLTGISTEIPALVLTVNGNSSKIDRGIISIVSPVAPIENHSTEVTFKAQLEDIQKKLDLSITQTAQLFGVTRKAVYDWMDGSAPRANIANRMHTIISIIENNVPQVNLKRLKTVWLMPVSGQSFLSVLADESLDEAARILAAYAKLTELQPRLGQEAVASNKTYLGNAHSSDIDRVADLG